MLSQWAGYENPVGRRVNSRAAIRPIHTILFRNNLMATLIKNRGYRIQDAIHQMAIDESQATGLSLNKTVEALIQEAYIARRLAKMGMTK